MRQTETFDAIVVGSGISGGWAAKELTERGLRVLLLERGKNVEHAKDYPNARKAPWEYPHRGGRTRAMVDAYPVLQARLSAEREEPRLVGQREGLALHRGQALRLVSRLPRRRTLAHVGPPELSPQRLRFRGQREGRHRGRLADPLRRHRAVVRPRRDATPASRDRLKACRSCPMASSSRRCRSTAPRRPSPARVAKQFDGTPADHPWPRRQSHAPLGRARPVPVPQRVLARMSVRLLLQHAVVDAAGGDGDRAADAEDVRASSPTSSTTAIASARPACA